MALALLLVLAAAGLWVGIRGASAATELTAARSLSSQLREEMNAGNVEAAAATIKRVSTHTEEALSLTSDPVWRAVELVPFAGPNLVAVRESSRAVDDVVNEVASPLLPLIGELDAGSFAGASIELEPLIAAAPMAKSAREAAEGIDDRVSQIEVGRTLPVVRDGVTELTGFVHEITETVQAVDRATTLLPGMLGANGRPRNYLVLFQNNAELRASGGLAGATAVLTATSGTLTLDGQRSTEDYAQLAEPVLPLTAAETALYGTNLGRFVQDVNLTPDFNRTGELAKAMAEPMVGVPIDGVLAIDPYVLSYVLAATGPVQMANGTTLTSDNAVQLLLSDVYATIEKPEDQDAFFGEVTQTVFDVLATRDVESALLLSAIARGGDEGRIRIWSADDAEQAVLAETTLAGVPATGTEQVLGVYLNDATGAKMDFYLDTTVSTSCGEGEQRVTVELNSRAPADAATSLTPYVTGNGTYGVAPGTIRTQVLVVLPPGARPATIAGTQRTVVRDDADRVVLSQFIELEPGASGSVVVDYTGAVPTRITSTPGITVNSPERGQAFCL